MRVIFSTIVIMISQLPSRPQINDSNASKTVNPSSIIVTNRCTNGYAIIDLPNDIRMMVPLAPMGTYGYRGTDGIFKNEVLQSVSTPDFCSISLSEKILGQYVYFDLRQTRVSYNANCDYFVQTNGIRLDWHRKLCDDAINNLQEIRLIDAVLPGSIRIHGRQIAHHSESIQNNSTQVDETNSFRVVPSLKARSFNAYSIDRTVDIRFMCTRTSGGPTPIDAIFCSGSPKSDLSYSIGSVVLRSEIDKLVTLVHASDAMIRESISRADLL